MGHHLFNHGVAALITVALMFQVIRYSSRRNRKQHAREGDGSTTSRGVQ